MKGEREIERESSNSQTLFDKDCRVGSVKTCLTASQRERENNSNSLFYKNCSVGSVKT